MSFLKKFRRVYILLNPKAHAEQYTLLNNARLPFRQKFQVR